MLPSNQPGAVSSPSVEKEHRKMNVIKATREYILDMVGTVSGVKVLLLDESTVS